MEFSREEEEGEKPSAKVSEKTPEHEPTDEMEEHEETREEDVGREEAGLIKVN